MVFRLNGGVGSWNCPDALDGTHRQIRTFCIGGRRPIGPIDCLRKREGSSCTRRTLTEALADGRNPWSCHSASGRAARGARGPAVGGRPGPRQLLWSNFRVTSRRCHCSKVPGVHERRRPPSGVRPKLQTLHSGDTRMAAVCQPASAGRDRGGLPSWASCAGSDTSSLAPRSANLTAPSYAVLGSNNCTLGQAPIGFQCLSPN
jgi:hypothetical protein